VTRAPLSLLPLPLALACGDATGTGGLTPDPAPKVRAVPSAVVFGRVPAGSVAAQDVVIENQGNGSSEALTLVGSDNTTCDAAGRFCLELASEALAPGAQVTGRILFHPDGVMPPATRAWTLACGEACEVALTGRGSGVEAPATSPAGVDFGRFMPGCGAAQEVILTSAVDVPLTVSEVSLEASSEGAYELVLQDSLPAALPAGGTLGVSLSFLAPAGDVQATLRFLVTAPGQGLADDYAYPVTVDIIGRGDQAETNCP